MIQSEFVEIAVEAPLPQPLTYRLPKNVQVQLGSRVQIPLGKRKSRGVVISAVTECLLHREIEIKAVEKILEEPVIGEKTRRWLKWLASYYLHPPGQVYSMAFARSNEKRKRASKKPSPTCLNEDALERRIEFQPNADQTVAIDSIVESARKKVCESFLLFGVTGSGKTEVYLRSIEHILIDQKQILVIVPEISLTPQLIKRFVGRFGENVAVLHSHLTDRERTDQWWSAVRGEKKIVVGARSALFCPLENLGLIIVDEEHESGFKQEEHLKYNGRDAAVMRAQFSQCPVILGSATPSLESWHNALTGKYRLLELPKRVEDRPLPAVEIVDMRKYKNCRDYALPNWMSPELHKELTATLENKEQAALFLNRRGFARFLLCPACGFTEQCPHCSVTLTVHTGVTSLLCHYCGFQKAAPPKCGSCKQDVPKPIGLGTEKISEDLKVLFPLARVARADRDEITNREELENLLDRINNREVDLIVGTQMIAKGHDFPDLTLVGTVLADVGLHFPDFRSSEKTFQLLTQVAGRAGRHKKAGKVIVQTYLPEHPAIRASVAHDFRNFATEELVLRKELGYPPFGRLAIIRIQGLKQDRVDRASMLVREYLEKLKKQKSEFQDLEILGPAEAILVKLRNRYRFQILLKMKSPIVLNHFLQYLIKDLDWLGSDAKLSVDVDPLYLL